MNLWLRLLWLLLTHRARPPLIPPLGVSRLKSRVWPLDLDLNGHLNNGRALTIMDVGRVDLMLRFGAVPVFLRRGWAPVLAATLVRYKRELRLFQPFVIETKVLHWEGANIFMQQSFILLNKDGSEHVACTALMRAGIYSRRDRRFVDAWDLMRALNFKTVSPLATEELLAFRAADRAISA